MASYDTSFVQAVIAAFQMLLAARGGLAGVSIFRYTPDSKALSANRQYIVLAVRIPGQHDHRILGRGVQYDSFTLHGEVVTFAPGAGDTAAGDAMLQGLTWYAEIEDAVRTTPDLGLSNKMTTILGGYEHDTRGADDRGRTHVLRFEVEVQSRLTTH